MSKGRSPYAGGECFREAFDNLMHRDLDDIEELLRLCHGQPRRTAEPWQGEPFAHAWAEVLDDDGKPFLVIDGGGVALAAEYYAVGKIDPAEVRRYTRDEAAELAIKTEVYGPWHDYPAGVLYGLRGKVYRYGQDEPIHPRPAKPKAASPRKSRKKAARD